MAMLKQLWMTGVLVAFSVFGIKVGLGLGAQVFNKTVFMGKRILIMCGSILVYLVLFFCLYYVISHFNLLNYLDRLMNMMQWGMLLHLAVAAGLFIWGIKLILEKPGKKESLPFHTSLLLILPCPVCATVILLNLTLAYSLFDLPPLLTTLTLFGFFSGIIVLTTAVLFPFRRRIGSGSSFLGQSMILIALYFLFVVIIAPIYPEIKAAFAMAVSNSPVSRMDHTNTAILVGIVLTLGCAGFIRSYFVRGGVK
jgi:predicted transporter